MFTRIALLKLSDLVKRKDFVEVVYADDKNITLMFADRSCNVSNMGNVTWNDVDLLIDKNQTE